VTGPHSDAAIMLRAMRSALGENDMMAYLAMMAVRLIELHRVLKPTGSIFLHCDPVASHYLKILLDSVFGPTNFRNEIIWKRTFAHGNVTKRLGDVTDTILYYFKSPNGKWNQGFKTLSPAEIESKYPNVDPDGRRWQSVTLRNPGFDLICILPTRRATASHTNPIRMVGHAIWRDFSNTTVIVACIFHRTQAGHCDLRCTRMKASVNVFNLFGKTSLQSEHRHRSDLAIRHKNRFCS
jgi:DNA methylase